MNNKQTHLFCVALLGLVLTGCANRNCKARCKTKVTTYDTNTTQKEIKSIYELEELPEQLS